MFETILQTTIIELLTYKLMMLLSSKVQEIVTPFTSTRIRDFVQEEYALMVDVDQNALIGGRLLGNSTVAEADQLSSFIALHVGGCIYI